MDFKGKRLKNENKTNKYVTDMQFPWFTTFCSYFMQHNYWLYNVLDDILMENTQIKSIIEIGAGYGGLTVFLGNWGIKLDVPVLSVEYDTSKISEALEHLTRLGVHVFTKDMWCKEFTQLFDSFVSLQPTFLVCDGGNKVREANELSLRIPADSILCMHDWTDEVTEEDVKDFPTRLNLQPYYKERWNEKDIRMAIFKKE